jgi:hypothetical protein
VIYNLMALVSQALDKHSKLKFLQAADCHPLRKTKAKRDGLQITTENFGDLKSIFRGLSGGKRGRKRKPRKE